jgi:hypothetical protein
VARLKRGKGQRVRSATERTRDKIRETELYDQGKTIKQIAKILKLSEGTVWRDFQELDEDWTKETMSNVHRLKMRQIRQIQNAKAEALEAWEKSKGGIHKTVKETTGGAEGTEKDGEKHRTEHTKSCGDPRFLAIYKELCAREATLIGLDTPKAATLTVPDEDGVALPIAGVVMLPARDKPPEPPEARS